MNLFIQSLMALATLSQAPAAAEAAPTVKEEPPAKVELASNLLEKLDDVAPTPARVKFWGQSWMQYTWAQINPRVIGSADDVAPPSPTEVFKLVTETK